MIQTFQRVHPPIHTDHQQAPEVFYPPGKAVPQAGYLLCRLGPSRSRGRRSSRFWDRSGLCRRTGTARSSRGRTCLPCTLQGQEGLGHGEHCWQPPPPVGSGSCSDTHICSHSNMTFGKARQSSSFVCHTLCPSCSPAVLKSSQNGNHCWCKNRGWQPNREHLGICSGKLLSASWIHTISCPCPSCVAGLSVRAGQEPSLTECDTEN